MVWEVIDDLEVVHPVAGVDGEQIAAGLGGGPVELPIVVYGIIVGRGKFYGVIFKEGQSIKVCHDMSEDAKWKQASPSIIFMRSSVQYTVRIIYALSIK